MKKHIQIGGLQLGSGRTKICVPLMGKTPEEFAAAARRAEKAGADLLEIRLDSLTAKPSFAEAAAVCAAVRNAFALPRILTFRTERDGGAGAGDPAFYAQLLPELAKSGCCEALDVELSCGKEIFAEIVKAAKVPVIGSSHDFADTPDVKTIEERLHTAEQWGAAIAKLAVMPKSRGDVIRLISAAAAAQETMNCPCIVIAMGALGAATRVCCGLTGSCLTFASAGKASAPGQMDVHTLKEMLSVLEPASEEKGI